MSSLLFANQDRLKTIARFLIYDKTISADQYDMEMEQIVEYKGKTYKIKAKVEEFAFGSEKE
jgi:Cft2 family RNA processing exonuclease